MSIEDNLKVIKDAKLDIELLRRKNEKLCETNNKEINNFIAVITDAEEMLEINLKESGEKKLECKLGYCSYWTMPDKWNYDIPKLISWAKEDDLRRGRYVKVTEEFKKGQLKKDYANGYLDVAIDDVCKEGLTITKQKPKFNYKISGGI